MSVCLNCLVSYKEGKNEAGKFCSLQCFRAYEHERKSVNGMGVGRMNSIANNRIKNKDRVYERSYKRVENLFENFDEKIDEAMDSSNWDKAREKSVIKVSELSPRGKTILKQALENQLKFLNQRLISIKN
jgi:hypothetical protein